MQPIPDTGIRLLLLLLFLHALSLGITQLVIPLYLLALGVSHAYLGMIIGTLGVAGLLLSIASSVLSDYLGRRIVILVSFVLWIVAGVVSLLASSAVWLAFVQFLIGLADLFLWISGLTYLTELTPLGKHAQIQGLGSGIMGIGMVVGPFVGGQVSQSGGFKAAFVLVVLLGLLGLAISYRLPEASHPMAELRDFPKQIVLSHLDALNLVRDNRSILLAISITAFGTMSWMTIGPTFYLAYLNRIGLSPEIIGILTTLRLSVGSLTRFGFGFLANRIGVVATSLLGFVTGGMALATTPFLTIVPLLTLVGCIGEGADRLRIPGIYTIIAERTEQGSLTLAFAMVNLSWATATTVVPSVMGLIAEGISLTATFLVTGTLVILSALVLYSFYRRTPCTTTKGQAKAAPGTKAN